MLNLTRKNSGSSHSYKIDGLWVPGATTVIDACSPKRLDGWAARLAAAHADEHWERLSTMRSADRIAEIEQAHKASNSDSIKRGHRLHALAEQVAKGQTVKVDGKLAPALEAIVELLELFDLTPLHTEATVGSAYGYAGTLDMLAESPEWGTVLLDIKTGKNVYETAALQLAAYRYADVIQTPRVEVGPRGGKKTVFDQGPMPAVDHCMVIHVGLTTASLVPVMAGPEQFAVFLMMLDVFTSWTVKTGWTYRDRDDAYNPVGPVIDGPEIELPEGF